MRFGTLCSGIGAPEAAWVPMGWEPVFASEIEKFPSAVHAHHYPDTPNYGDMTKWREWDVPRGSVDVICAGTPCQSFSVAGLRGGLDDARGNLALEFFRFVDAVQPSWIVWENVPGVLSSGEGRDFGSIIGALDELGYGWAYRVLDAQFFGVPQRRRRVFLVGCLGGWQRAAAVLFERDSLRRDIKKGSEKRKDVAPTISARPTGGGGLGTDFDLDGGLVQWPARITPTLNAAFGSKMGLEDQHALGGAGLFVPGEDHIAKCLTAHGQRLDFETETFIVNARQSPDVTKIAQSMDTNGYSQAVAFTASEQANSYAWERPHAPCLTAQQPSDTSNIQTGIRIGNTIRRLTPLECERLQGFPDHYTKIQYRNKPADQCPDGPRYKALGNSMAVPVLRWIGERIQFVDSIGSALVEKVG